MTCGLPEPKERLQDLHSRPFDSDFVDVSKQRLPVVRAQLVVEPPLIRFELTIDRLLGLGRQLSD